MALLNPLTPLAGDRLVSDRPASCSMTGLTPRMTLRRNLRRPSETSGIRDGGLQGWAPSPVGRG